MWIAAGSLSLALGIAGAALPLLPATPFLLLAAFCYAKGSQRLHRWLVTHPRFGKTVRDWNRHRAISARAKRLAAAAMALALAISFLSGVPWAVIAVQAAVLSCAAAFVLTRPDPPD